MKHFSSTGREHEFGTVIKSRGNSTFKKILSLHSSKGIKLNRLFLAGGEKIVDEVLADKTERERIALWIRTPHLPPPPASVLSSAKTITVSKELFRELNEIGTAGPLLGLNLPDISAFSAEASWPDGCTVFIPFGDPENIGAVARAAFGLGASRAVLLQEAACPFLPRAVRASAGAILRIRLETGPSLADFPAVCRKTPVFALDLKGEHLNKVDWPASFGLIAGMEGKGLPYEVRKNCIPVSIPLAPGLESLNAATAMAIALWTWKTKRIADA